MSDIDSVIKDIRSLKARKAKEELKRFVVLINKELNEYFDKEIKNAFGVSSKEKDLTINILKHIKEHNLRPCKRLRGSFIYHGYKLLGGEGKKAILSAAMSVELIHTALLIHDDFMDQDDTRRGLPTTHEYYKNKHISSENLVKATHYGDSMAVNVGDVALMLGFEILGKSQFDYKNRIRALNRTLKGINNTGLGQAFDITLEVARKAKEKDVLDLHLAKTAIYTYENPLHIGAILAGANESELKILSDYALPGGVAFQLQDDILGLFGTPEETGKPNNSDLRQGKMTLLILHAWKKADDSQKRVIKRAWGNQNVTEKQAETVRRVVVNTGSLEYSRKVAIKWARKAQKAIPEMVRRGWNINSIDYLDGIAQYMVERRV